MPKRVSAAKTTEAAKSAQGRARSRQVLAAGASGSLRSLLRCASPRSTGDTPVGRPRLLRFAPLHG